MTDVEGAWRRDSSGISATITASRVIKSVKRPVIDVVLLPGELYNTTASGERWISITPQDGRDQYYSPLAGFGLASTVGAELDHVRPEAATMAGTAEENLDGVAVTRYDLKVDPAKMAPRIEDPYRRKAHEELAAEKGVITASVWLDGSGLPLKTTYLIPCKESRGSTTSFSARGKPVEIAAPSADRIVPRDSWFTAANAGAPDR